MNRYVAVPRLAYAAGEIPEKAYELAKMYSLELRASDDVEEVVIVAAPETSYVEYANSYVTGRIWSLNIVDEFADMSNNPYMLVGDSKVRPAITEKHALKFRVRMRYTGSQDVLVFVDDKCVLELTLEQAQ